MLISLTFIVSEVFLRTASAIHCVITSYHIIARQYCKKKHEDFVSKCYQIRSFLRIWSYLLKKPIVGNLMFWAVEFERLALIFRRFSE